MAEPTTAIFSLRTSAYNDFLYAAVGEEDNGMVLTMLSALARSGVDPWDEAERLNALPKEAATKRLALMISGQSRGQWAPSAVTDIASRLIARLPVKQRSGQTAPVKATPAPSRKMMLLLLCLVLIVVSARVLTVLDRRDQSPPSEQTHSAHAPPPSPPQPKQGKPAP